MLCCVVFVCLFVKGGRRRVIGGGGVSEKRGSQRQQHAHRHTHIYIIYYTHTYIYNIYPPPHPTCCTSGSMGTAPASTTPRLGKRKVAPCVCVCVSEGREGGRVMGGRVWEGRE